MPGVHHTPVNNQTVVRNVREAESNDEQAKSKIAWDGASSPAGPGPAVLNVGTAADVVKEFVTSANGCSSDEEFDAFMRSREEEEALIIQKLINNELVIPKPVERHWLLDGKLFLTMVYGTIIVNSIQMGFAADHPDLVDLWKTFEHLFTGIFLCEMMIKMYFLKVGYFSSGWNRMDFLLVTMSVIDNWILGLLFDQGDSPLGQMSVLRGLRILRVARMARLLKVFRELFIIIKGMMESLKTIFWVCLLLLMAMYVSSILCVDVMGRKNSPYEGYNDEIEAVEDAAGAYDFNNYLFFGTMTRSMYTLFIIAMGENSSAILRPVAEKQWFMIFFFIGFIIFMSFGVLNVIVGSIVESTHEAAKQMELDDIAKIRKQKLGILAEIRNLIFALDADNSGAVSLAEMHAGWDDPKFRNLILQADLPQGFTPEEMLALLDTDADGKLNFEEFMTSFYRIIAEDPFQKSCCMHAGLNEVKRDCKLLHEKVDREVEAIKHEVSSVHSSLKNEISSVASTLSRLEALLSEGIAGLKLSG